MNIKIEYKYHCQHQAEAFAKSIINVPIDYPLREGLPEGFQVQLTELCELAKDIYMDMARQPEAYGLMLVDIESKDGNLARDGYRTIHRFYDTLERLCQCGELENHQLTVTAEEFRKTIRAGGRGYVANPVPKYELMLSRLVDFGFVISDFEGNQFNKKVETFTVEYPDYPEMIDTIKAYHDCWKLLLNDHNKVVVWEKFGHNRYRFDYKVTADIDKIPILQWISDQADYHRYSPEQKAFSIAFYEYSLQYKDVKCVEEYFYKSKRIARIQPAWYTALGELNYLLSLKLKNPDKYMDEIEKMSNSIKSQMTKDSCRRCNFQGATDEHCKFRVCWTFEGKQHTGCAHACFFFDDFDMERVSDYWRLLELEYGLKKV